MKKFYILLFVFCNTVFAQERNYDHEYIYLEALRYKYAQNYNNAFYLLNQILKKDSNNCACYYEISQIYENINDIENAIHYAKKLNRICKNNINYKILLANLVVNYNYNYDEDILPLLFELYHDTNTYIDEKLLLIRHLARNKESKKLSVKYLNLLLKKYGFDSVLIDELYALAKVDKSAYKLLKEITQKYENNENNENKSIKYVKLFVDIKQKKYKNFRKEVFTNFDLNDFNTEIIYLYSLVAANDNDEKTHLYTLLDSFVNSAIIEDKYKIKILKSILEINNPIINNYIKNQFVKSIRYKLNQEIFYEFINYYYKNADYNNYMSISEKFVKFYPENIIALNNLLTSYYINNCKDKIYDTFIKNRKFIDTPLANYIIGITAVEFKQFDLAKRLLIMSIMTKENFPFKSHAVNVLSEIFYNENSIDSLKFFYEYALNNNFLDIIGYNNYAYYLAEYNVDLKKAEMLSAVTIIKQPKNASYLDTYAWIQYRLKNFDLAYKYINMAYKLEKKNHEILKHKIYIIYCLNKKKLAHKLASKYKINIQNIECK